MKKTLLPFCLLLSPISYSLAQTIINHPLNKTNMIVNDAEIALIHSVNNNSQNLSADLFNYDPKLGVGARIKSVDGASIRTTGSGSMKSMNTISLDFNGDKFDDIVYAYQNNNKGITLTVPILTRNSLKMTSSQSIPVTNGATSGYVPRIRLGKADFDRDGKDELVLAFRNFSNEKTIIQIYKIEFNSIPVLQTEVANVTFGYLGGTWKKMCMILL